MKHFVRVVMEKREDAALLDESIFTDQSIYETEQNTTVYEIALPRQLSEQESDEYACLLYTSPSPRDGLLSRMPSSA